MDLTIRRALISVSDKTGIVDFARELAGLGVAIISTGNTAKTLRERGITVQKVSDVTGFPEILGGRVKTLHPKIHGGLLARRDKDDHLDQLEEHGIDTIDLVVVNLYPFSKTVASPNVTEEDALENIDIGGPTMIRAAAKNYPGVAVVVNAQRYGTVLEELRGSDGTLSEATRRSLAAEAFAHTHEYDGAIVRYLTNNKESRDAAFTQETFSVTLQREATCRYGENPHQDAFIAREVGAERRGLLDAEKLQGKAMSYNNFVDFQAAWDIVREFDRPASVLIKHTNPCGVAVHDSLKESFVNAHKSDPVSAFGGVFALNREIDTETAEVIAAIGFFEGVIAPAYSEAALELFAKKKNVRVLRLPEPDFSAPAPQWNLHQITGGFLVQHADTKPEAYDTWKVVTERQPTPEEMTSLKFAWTVAKHVKSNAIVLVREHMTVGVGAGQMSRVDSTRVAGHKAGERAQGSVLASDAFFPFRDGIDQAAEVGAKAVIQPGGSIRDEEVIAAANEHGMTMIFTGRRHFRH